MRYIVSLSVHLKYTSRISLLDEETGGDITYLTRDYPFPVVWQQMEKLMLPLEIPNDQVQVSAPHGKFSVLNHVHILSSFMIA